MCILWSILFFCLGRFLGGLFNIGLYLLFILIFFYTMETEQSILFTPELENLELKLRDLNQEMESLAKEGKYVLAQNCRKNVEKLQKDINQKRKDTLKTKHKQEGKEVKKMLKETLTDFQNEWLQKMIAQKEKGDQLRAQLKERQNAEWQEELERLEGELPSKGKESSELLRLHISEQSLAKMHNFKEAHTVQQKIKELKQQEEQEFQKSRQEKISNEMKQFQAKQKIEAQALEKKIATEKWELELSKTKEEAQLVLKHSVISKEMKSQNKKENLMTSGMLKSRIDVVSPGKSMATMTVTRSRLLSGSRSQKELSLMTR